jgi:DNA-binding FadR family transcriptional regulator
MSRLHREKLGVLLRDVLDDRFPPGTMLPREQDLALDLDVSRGVARECVRALEERGVVSVKHGRGTTVRPVAEWNLLDPDVLAALLLGSREGWVLEQLLECRRLLEPQAAADAAAAGSPDGLEAVREAAERLGTTADGTRRREGPARLAADFHRAVVLASGNRVMAAMLAPAHAAIELMGDGVAGRDGAREERERIARVIERGQARAARTAVLAHLDAEMAALAVAG